MREILDPFQHERRCKGKCQLLSGGSSRDGHSIRRDQSMGISFQLERELMVFNRRRGSNRISDCGRRKETNCEETETDEAIQTIHPSPAP